MISGKERARYSVAVCVAGDSGIGEESAHFVDENTDGRFYTEDENIHVLLEFSHKYVYNVHRSIRSDASVGLSFLRP